jgi:Tir chaperone protein (CesT) family
MAIAQTRFSNIFKELGAAVGADLMPDDNGVVSLTFDDDVTVSIEAPADSEFIYFHSPVKRLDGDRAEELEAAMRINLFELSVSGAWLALDSNNDELVLCYSLLGDVLDADKLANVLEALTAAVRELRAAGAAALDNGQPKADGAQGANDFIRV